MQTVFVQAFATEMGDDDFGWGNHQQVMKQRRYILFQWKLLKHPKSVTVNEAFI